MYTIALLQLQKKKKKKRIKAIYIRQLCWPLASTLSQYNFP